MTLANIITITRIGLIPFFAIFVLYYSESVSRAEPAIWQYYLSIFLFVLIAIADGVDGYVARKYNQQTKLGSILDPLADKLLLLTALIILSIHPSHAFPKLPIWFAIIVLSRDVLLGLGVVVVFLMGKTLEVKPNWIGKVATLFQMITIGLVLLRIDEVYLSYPLWAAGIFTGISGVIYIVQGSKKLGG
jgi:CDP-diacylglycerol--glycerol-3-phosphate 3-phosphatidyltransferase